MRDWAFVPALRPPFRYYVIATAFLNTLLGG